MVADANVVLYGVAANDQFRSIRIDAGSTSRDVVADDVIQDREGCAGRIDAAAELLLVLLDGGTCLVFLDDIVRDRRRTLVDIEPTAYPRRHRHRTAPSASDQETVDDARAGLVQRHDRVLAVAFEVRGVGSRVAHGEVARGPTGVAGRGTADVPAIEADCLVLEERPAGHRVQGRRRCRHRLRALGRRDPQSRARAIVAGEARLLDRLEQVVDRAQLEGFDGVVVECRDECDQRQRLARDASRRLSSPPTSGICRSSSARSGRSASINCNRFLPSPAASPARGWTPSIDPSRSTRNCWRARSSSAHDQTHGRRAHETSRSASAPSPRLRGEGWGEGPSEIAVRPAGRRSSAMVTLAASSRRSETDAVSP